MPAVGQLETVPARVVRVALDDLEGAVEVALGVHRLRHDDEGVPAQRDDESQQAGEPATRAAFSRPGGQRRPGAVQHRDQRQSPAGGEGDVVLPVPREERRREEGHERRPERPAGGEQQVVPGEPARRRLEARHLAVQHQAADEQVREQDGDARGKADAKAEEERRGCGERWPRPAAGSSGRAGTSGRRRTRR